MKQQTNRRKRGQAALEFLSTYGFAFLIILVMIGALSYFGVLNPTNLLPDRCTTPPEIGCQEFRVSESGNGNLTLQIAFQNNIGSTTTFDELTVSSNYGSATCDYDGDSTIQVRNGGTFEIDCEISADSGQTFPSDGDKVRLDFLGTYTESGSRFGDRTWTGDLFATIQP